MLAASPADADPPLRFIPPVDGAIGRGFEEPQRRWGPGHRGIDIAAPVGTPVRAAAVGTVSYAGSIGSMTAVTVAHGGGIETTYSSLDAVSVVSGERVTEGAILGTTGRSHEGDAYGVHLGMKLDGRYVDPSLFLALADTGSAIHLAPEMWSPPESMGESFAAAFREPGTTFADCVSPPRFDLAEAPAPTDNIAVAVAGIGSATGTAEIHLNGPEALGYDEVYDYSYAGVDEGDLHRPYQRKDTFDDINVAAGKLRAQLVAIGRHHPGRAIDLFAHSQGGIVARTLLARAANTSDLDMPPIEHLVTFATPHAGAPLAAETGDLEDDALGRAILRVAERAAAVLKLPDPGSIAVRQLAPGSDLMDDLAGETVLYGTRVLTLAIPHDVVVPAHAALLEGSTTKVVGPEGINGHDAVVSSEAALATAYQFLRGGPAPCRDGWDRWGPRLGRAIGWAEGRLSELPHVIGRF